MEEQKIKGIPPVGEIILESTRVQWELFSKEITSKFSTTAVITVNQETNRKVRITIVMEKIIDPKLSNLKSEIIPIEIKGYNNSESGAIIQSDQFFRNEIDKTIWIFIGYIIGKVNKPIIILLYEKFNYFTYSMINNENDLQKYFPEGVPQPNPHLN